MKLAGEMWCMGRGWFPLPQPRGREKEPELSSVLLSAQQAWLLGSFQLLGKLSISTKVLTL